LLLSRSDKIPLSVVVAAYNEERFIEKCLASVSWADEIIVVDGGSTDRTVTLVKRSAARLISSSNAPAETQRLKGLSEIGNDWFFLLDADERVSGALRDQISEVVRSSRPERAYYVLRRNYYQNRPVHLHHPDHQLRLFHKSQISALPQEIHRIPQVQGTTGTLEGELIHRFFTSIPDYLKKLNRYTEIEASYVTERSEAWSAWTAFKRIVLRPIGRFFQYYFFKQGYRDGFFGLFYSVSSAYYEFVTASSVIIRPDKGED